MNWGSIRHHIILLAWCFVMFANRDFFAVSPNREDPDKAMVVAGLFANRAMCEKAREIALRGKNWAGECYSDEPGAGI